MSYEYQITRRVEFADTDMAGIMHFANYFRFMETAETAFLRSLGLSVVLSRGDLEVCLPRVHAECDYASPLRFEDEVLIRVLVEKKGNRSLTYQFRFQRLNGVRPQEVARGQVTAVCARRQADGTLTAIRLPKLIADKIQQAPASVLAGGDLAEATRLDSSAAKPARRSPTAGVRKRRPPAGAKAARPAR